MLRAGGKGDTRVLEPVQPETLQEAKMTTLRRQGSLEKTKMLAKRGGTGEGGTEHGVH